MKLLVIVIDKTDLLSSGHCESYPYYFNVKGTDETFDDILENDKIQFISQGLIEKIITENKEQFLERDLEFLIYDANEICENDFDINEKVNLKIVEDEDEEGNE